MDNKASHRTRYSFLIKQVSNTLPFDNIAKWYKVLVFLAFLSVPVAFGIFLHHKTVAHPHSVIDDMLILKDAMRLHNYQPQEGFWRALRRCDTIQHLYGNLGFLLFRLYTYRLSGFDPYVQHLIRLVTMCILTILVFLLGRGLAPISIRQTRKTDRHLFYLSASIACVFALAFCIVEVPGWSNRHALQAHWYRLHTTDPPAAVALLLHFVALYRALVAYSRGKTRGAWVWVGVSSFLIVVASSMRPTTMAFAAIPFGLSIIPIALRDRRGVLLIGSFMMAAALVTAYMLLLRWLRGSFSLVSSDRYGSEVSFRISTLHLGWIKYKNMIDRTFGPLVITITASFLMRLFFASRNKNVLVSFWEKNIAHFYTLLGSATAIAIFLPWSQHVARYLLLFVIWFVLFSSLELISNAHFVSRCLRKPNISKKVGLGFLVGCLVCYLSPSYWFAVILPLCALAYLVLGKGKQYVSVRVFISSYFLGSALLPLIFLFWSGMWSSQAFAKHFFEVEKFDLRLVDKLAETLQTGKCINSLMKPTDERMGGMCIYLRLVKRLQPCFEYPVSLDRVPEGGLVFVSSTSPQFDEVEKKFMTIWKEERLTRFVVPVAYDVWRTTLLGQTSAFFEEKVTSETAILAKRVQ